MYGLLTIFATQQFLMADISFNIACKELKIAQIAQLNQLFQLLHLVHIYGHGFYELSRMLMRKNVNNDVSKDSPIDQWKCRINLFSHNLSGNFHHKLLHGCFYL